MASDETRYTNKVFMAGLASYENDCNRCSKPEKEI